MIAKRCSRCGSKDVVYIVYGCPLRRWSSGPSEEMLCWGAPRFGLRLPTAFASSAVMRANQEDSSPILAPRPLSRGG
jgi:hypothetical protein